MIIVRTAQLIEGLSAKLQTARVAEKIASDCLAQER